MSASAGHVVVAVVVATYNRSGLLPRLMKALAAQEAAPPYEVVVVDDCSPDDTAAVLDRLAVSAPFPMTVIRQPTNRGPAAARNRGWRASTAPLICFTDDDCVPSPGWLAAMANALANFGIVQGCTLPAPDQLKNWGPFSHTLDVRSETGYYETANMGYRREVLECVGGFNETFSHPYGEDCELAWRAKEDGSSSIFVDKALVHHDITRSDFRSALRSRRRLEGIVQVLKCHPTLRRQLGMRLFLEPPHARALTVVATGSALAASPRSPLRWTIAAAAGLHYAWECRHSRMGPAIGTIGWLAVVPGAFIIDLASIAVLARASVKHRTLLL